MTESYSNASVSSTSSLNSSFPDTEDDQTIASILAEEGNSQVAGRLGKRLSHLDSIPVFSFPHLYFLVHTTCLHVVCACVCVCVCVCDISHILKLTWVVHLFLPYDREDHLKNYIKFGPLLTLCSTKMGCRYGMLNQSLL